MDELPRHEHHGPDGQHRAGDEQQHPAPWGHPQRPDHVPPPLARTGIDPLLFEPVLALPRDLVPCGLSVWCELDETGVSADSLEPPQLASSPRH